MRCLIAATVALILSVAPAWAEPAHFQLCDGYGAPNKKGDGITTDALFLGLMSTPSDMRPTGVSAGESGLEACDAALADPLLRPDFTLRRVHLLQARAIHQIAAGRPAEARASLDEAAAVPLGLSPGLREKGLDIANKAIAAFARIDQGDKAGALALIDQLEARRPDSVMILALGDILRAKLDSGLDAQLALARKRAPLVPAYAIEGLLNAVTASRFADAATFGSGLTVNLPRMRGGWALEGDSGSFTDYDLISFRAELAGATAYSLVAVGRGETAAARIAAAKAEIEEAVAPPPPPKPGRQLGKATVADFERRKQEGAKAVTSLDRWEKLIVLRERAKTLDPAAFFAELKRFPAGSVPVVPDLIMQLPTPTPQDRADRDAFVAELRAKLESQRLAEVKADLATFVRLLPRPETDANQAHFHKAGDGYFLSDNGFSSRRMDEGDDHWTVRFTSALATPATVDELALLSAAQFARKQGYDSFIIESRRNVERTTHVSGMWTGRYDVNSGREAQMTIRLVRAGRFPADLQGAEWRMLQVDRLIAELTAAHPQTVDRRETQTRPAMRQ